MYFISLDYGDYLVIMDWPVYSSLMNPTTQELEMNTDVTVRPSAHATCDHPKTKAARAACRRARNSDWVIVARGDERVAKGDTVRVHTADVIHEGQLLGWGESRMIIRVNDTRKMIPVADVTTVEVKLV
jgi:hypothetical protein